MSSVINNLEMYSRQLDLFNPSDFEGVKVAIIGSGSVGSFTALTLAKMGIKDITIYDFDTIEKHNISNQFFRMQDITKLKVDAIKEVIKEFCDIDVKVIKEKIDEENIKNIDAEIVIASTDDMSSRKIIYEYCKQSGVRLFVDARMGGEVMRIYSISPSLPQEKKFYEASLYEDKEVNGEKCTAKTIIYNVLLIASLITSQIKKYLTQEDIMNELIFDFKTLIFNSRKA